MSRVLVQKYFALQGGRKAQVLVLHFLPGGATAERVEQTLSDALRGAGSVVDAVYLQGHEEDVLAATELLRDADSIAMKRLHIALHEPESQIWQIFLHSSSMEILGRSLSGVTLSEAGLAELCRSQLQHLFAGSGALHTLPRSIHYRKQSGKHTQQYLKASDVLSSGVEVPRLVFWLLPVAARVKPTRIVVDTAGISAVAYLLAAELLRFSAVREIPLVESHQSYSGLSSVSYREPGSSLWLLSATTSGDLLCKLAERGVKRENVVTFFYLGPQGGDAGEVLCSLARSSVNPDGFDVIENYAEADCPLCKSGSLALTVRGENFDLEPPAVDLIDLTLDDLPSEKQRYLEALTMTGLFRIGYVSQDRSFEIFCSGDALIGDPVADSRAQKTQDHTRSRWDAAVVKGLSVAIKTVVHGSYPGSRALADKAATKLPSPLSNATTLCSSKDLSALQAEPCAAALVVSAAIDDGVDMMSINKDLRSRHPKGNAHYVTPVLRTKSADHRRHLVSNLTFGEHGKDTFTFQAIHDIELPECRKPHPWDRELRRLIELQEWLDEVKGESVAAAIARRRECLEQMPAKGERDSIFWPSTNGEALRIRSDFTLLPTDGGNRLIAQADIFVCIASLLHQLRLNKTGKRLVCKPYEQSVLSPRNFIRFNDGVIQASLLRAAMPSELAYGVASEEVSHEMAALICDAVRNHANTRGEAALEFLVALLIGQMSLRATDLQRIVGQVEVTPICLAAKQIAGFLGTMTAQR